MSGVKLYDISGFGGGMIEREDGAWLHVDDYSALEAERDQLRVQVEALRAALEVVAEWRLPETGQRWASGEPMSYGACYGSNGERDFMRYLATEALQAKP